MEKNTYYSVSRKVSLISILVDGGLSVLKVLLGILGNSQVVLLDGIHSFSDLATDLVTFFVIKLANEPPDEEHPYGHGKIETVTTLLIAFVLFLVAFFLLKDNIERFMDGDFTIPYTFTLFVALFSIVVKEILFRYTLIKGREINSELLIANAHHHRSDSLSSIAALIGLLIMIYTPFKYGEVIASFVVIFMILKAAYDIGKDAFLELIDTAVEPEEKKEIIEKILSKECVLGYHHFRIIKSGLFYKVEIDIELKPDITLEKAHHISKEVKEIIKKDLKNTIHVIVHMDPYKED